MDTRCEILADMESRPWAIHRPYLQSMINALSTREAAYAPDTRSQRAVNTSGKVAVLPLLGPITQRAGLFTALFGGTSTEKWGRAFDDLIAARNVTTIVIDVDSPGGSVAGVQELGDKIFQARQAKRVVAVANGWAASAAYWLASQAGELIVTPSGEVGSIGVWSMHVDRSGELSKAGISVTLTSAGKFKTEGNPYEPLGDEARTEEQRAVDFYHTKFISAVARGRNTSQARVRSDFGKGRLVRPEESLATGMVDSIATLQTVIKRETGARSRAQAEQSQRNRRLTQLEAECGIESPAQKREEKLRQLEREVAAQRN